MTEDKIDELSEESTESSDNKKSINLEIKDGLLEHLKDLSLKEEELSDNFESYSFDLKEEKEKKKGLLIFVDDENSVNELIALNNSLEEARKEVNDRLLRFVAEFENYKKRVSQEKSQAANYIKETLLREMLNFIDNFERGLVLYKDKEESSSFYKGMSAVFKECDTFLAKNNVKKIETNTNDDFNPSLHEAIEVKPSKDVGKDKIISVIQNGYLNNDKLLRPSLVSVSSGETQ